LYFCFDFISSGYFFSNWCGSRVKLALLESLAKASRAPKGIKEYEYVIIWATSLDSYLQVVGIYHNIRLAEGDHYTTDTHKRPRDEENKRVSKKGGNKTLSLRTLRPIPTLLRSTFLVWVMNQAPTAHSLNFLHLLPCFQLVVHVIDFVVNSRRRLRGLGKSIRDGGGNFFVVCLRYR
jgi:hypothetical protein